MDRKDGIMRPPTSTLKPPPRTIKPPPSLRAPPASFPAANSAQRAGGGRGRKVALQPGFSPLDWANLKASGKDLRGIEGGLIKVDREELKKHNTPEDAWTTLQGKVYNITPYLHFHPGGEKELMKCAGKDGTKLFMWYHSWVNFDNMLDRCLVGYYSG
ncbi:hypothetical protein TRVA0_025S00606 [Trichomonascus vanleenenianus]|uniref:cytochrome b5-like heme/steroid binding domain-containing protein n=1 Tax=Trichomonascus vanleenenianus TaxID=2268995 RepID=UPI003EC9ADA2